MVIDQYEQTKFGGVIESLGSLTRLLTKILCL